MASCIQPTCDCQAYEAPKHSKGTLLQLRLGCQSCGHQASEHRKVTAIDRYIEKEVNKAAKSKRCGHQIPRREIPLSPVFRQYDLIPLPDSDDSGNAADEENSVQCTCTGFQIQSLVRVWQKFRTHPPDSVSTSLPTTLTCSFCQHPLSDHLVSKAEPPPPSIQPPAVAKSSYRQLVVKESTNLAFSPLNSNCVLLLPPESFDQYMTLLAIGKTSDSRLELVAVSHRFSLKKEEGGALKNNHNSDETDKEKKENGDAANVSLNEQGVATDVEMISPVAENKDQSTKKKGTKRRRNTSSTNEDGVTRRSARIAAAKKIKTETDMLSPTEPAKQQLKDLKASRARSRLPKNKKSKAAPNISQHFLESICQVEEEEDVIPSKEELERVEESSTLFAQLLKNPDSFKTQCSLPSDLPFTDSHLMMAAQIVANHVIMNEPNTEEKDKDQSKEVESCKQDGPCIVVAVGLECGSEVHLTLVRCASGCKETDVVPEWTALKLFSASTDQASKLSSFSWSRVCEKSQVVYFSAGCMEGDLYVWRVRLTTEQSKIEGAHLLSFQNNAKSQITLCNWAPNGRILVAGTLFGELLVYQIGGEESDGVSTSGSEYECVDYLQTLQCCGGSVMCGAWSRDSRLVAVGGSDDSIQILQCKEPSKTRPPLQPSASSLFKYFKRDDSGKKQKFVHTHTLRGHQSFIADVSFIGSNHSLVSIGWDGQILFWPNLLLHSLPKPQLSSHHHTHPQHKDLPHTEVEPQGGYKLGPSTIVEFLPLSVHPLISNCGLNVLLQKRLGGFTVLSYLRKSA